jgi:hypothetical protein
MNNGDLGFAGRIHGLPVHRAARAAACSEFDRAERAAEWTVRIMDRLEALIDGMRRATRAADSRVVGAHVERR